LHAVIGPTRMQYARSIASVDYLAEVLTGLMHGYTAAKSCLNRTINSKLLKKVENK